MILIDAEYLQHVIDTHGPALLLYARQWCRSPEDALQETWIQLINQTQPPENLLPWLYVTVRRRAMNLMRGDTRRDHHHQQSGIHQDQWFLPDSDRHESVDFQQLIAELPRTDREILVARVWGELSFSAIADLVDLSVSSVHRRYHEAIAALKRSINASENTEQNHEAPSIRHA